MATKVALASTSWVLRERETIAEMLPDEKRDMMYAAAREAEWVNEHLFDILSKAKM